MINPNLTRKQLRVKTTEQLLRILEYSSYLTRDKAIGNNQTIQYVFEILHYERKVLDEIDCETAFCFENCVKKQTNQLLPFNN
jgi:hypothetical protein